MDNKQQPQKVIKEFSPAEKAAFEKDMQEVLQKHSAILICKPFIANNGVIDAVLQVFKSEIPSPYVEPTPEGGVKVAEDPKKE